MPAMEQESVWDYPRPPRIEDVAASLRVVIGGVTVAETTRGKRVLETSQPPAYYFPPEDVDRSLLTRTTSRTFCEWKGNASYWSVTAGGRTVDDAAWSYESPTPAFESITGYLAFYAQKADACFVGHEQVEPNPGSFYGGWITANIVGPFKGGPGTAAW